MELYLQMGHGMQSMAEELIGLWGGGNVIISPVNITQDRVVGFSKKITSIGGNILFDPQMFYPKEGHMTTGHRRTFLFRLKMRPKK